MGIFKKKNTRKSIAESYEKKEIVENKFYK